MAQRFLVTDDTDGKQKAVSLTQKNVIVNGGMDFWQRGTSLIAGSFTSGTSYLADQWTAFASTSAGTLSNEYTQIIESPTPYAKYCVNMQATSVSGVTLSSWNIYTKLELDQARDLIGKKCYLSFWYKSNRTGNHGYYVYSYSSSSYVLRSSFTVSAANTWEYKTVSLDFTAQTAGSVVKNASYLEVGMGLKEGSNGQSSISTGDYFRFTAVQLNVGTMPSTFSRAGGSVEGELALCQRYYEKSYNVDVDPGTATSTGAWTATSPGTGFDYTSFFQVSKRATPTITYYSSSGVAGKTRNTALSTDIATGDDLTPGHRAITQNIPVTAVGTLIVGHFVADASLP